MPPLSVHHVLRPERTQMATQVSEVPTAGASESDTDTAITLGVLHAVHADSAVTQRRLAGDLGIALGLTNAYLRRCVRKGLVKVSQAPPNRYLYYLTPKGFAEKSRLTGEYLSDSFSFFRNARNQCADALKTASNNGWHCIALYGTGELAEIATLAAEAGGIARILAVVDARCNESRFAGLPVVAALSDLDDIDAVLLTDMRNAQTSYRTLCAEFPADRLLIPDVLRVVTTKP